MAQGHLHLDTETLSCSICLELLRDPVTIPCGHNYCLSCITHHWDTEGESGIHSCPQCRKIFVLRPQLLKNTTLAAVVEQLKETGVHAAPADRCCYAGAGDVACDVCTGRKLKALKSCLACLASYCEKHLQPHYDAAPLREHQLAEPSNNLRDNICAQHDEVMKMFCRSDQHCVCHVCCVDQHRDHDVVSAAAERSEKQKKLQETLQSIQRGIQGREGELKQLEQEMMDIKLSADVAVKHSHNIYTELIRLMEKRHAEVEQRIRSQQEAEVRRLKELERKLEQELSELRSKAVELQQLSLTEDHCRFLHSYSSAWSHVASTGSSGLRIRPGRRFQEVTAAVSECGQKIQRLLKDTQRNISLSEVELWPAAEPKTRKEFLRYSRKLNLDQNTAHRNLMLSEENRRATDVYFRRRYPDHADRFRNWYQVLSREGLTGRCYWEVKVRRGGAYVAVAYKNISRDGAESEFGSKNQSWTLYCHSPNYKFRSEGVWSKLSGPWSSTVGVYLDHAAGLLSFYSVSNSMTLLHRVQTAFTEPLHAGLGVHWYSGGSCELVKLG